LSSLLNHLDDRGVNFFGPVFLRLFLVGGTFDFLATESVGFDGFFVLGGDGIGD
jgi:hypothetical protein